MNKLKFIGCLFYKFESILESYNLNLVSVFPSSDYFFLSVNIVFITKNNLLSSAGNTQKSYNFHAQDVTADRKLKNTTRDPISLKSLL